MICSDKTGTLTKGEMTAVRLWFHGDVFKFTGVGYAPAGVSGIQWCTGVRSLRQSLEVLKVQNPPKDVKSGPHTLPIWLSIMCRRVEARKLASAHSARAAMLPCVRTLRRSSGCALAT